MKKKLLLLFICLPLIAQQFIPTIGGGVTPIPGCSLSYVTKLSGWYRAQDALCSGVACTNGGSVTTWPDHSAAGHNLTAGTNGTFVSSFVNGQNGVNFTRATYFTGANVAAGSTSAYAVLALNSTANRGYFTGNNGAANSFGWNLPNSGSTAEQALDAVGIAPIGAGNATPDTNPHQLNAIYTDGGSGSVFFRIDRTADGNASSTQTLGAIVNEIGRPYTTAAPTDYLNAVVEEVLFYTEASSNTNRDTIEAYLNCRSGK